MRYTWDSKKAQTNLETHEVDFADAVGVFEDEYSLYQQDVFPTYGEDRFVVVGIDFLGRVLAVVYTYRGNVIRLVSARKATKQERNDYERQYI